MEQITKFDPSTIMQGVKDRIKETFVNMIPDEQWEQMIKREVDDFFQPRDVSWSREHKSNFQLLVREIIRKEASDRMAKYLCSPEFETTWSTNGVATTSEAVKEIIVNNSGEILVNMFGGMFSTMLQDFKNQLRSSTY